jgi:hypothetical protein
MASTIHLGIGKICVAKCEGENGQITQACKTKLFKRCFDFDN